MSIGHCRPQSSVHREVIQTPGVCLADWGLPSTHKFFQWCEIHICPCAHRYVDTWHSKRIMLQRKLRFMVVFLLASLVAVSSDGQTRRKSTKKAATSAASRARAKKRAAKRSRKPAAPAVPVVHYTTPRTVESLAADLGSMSNRIRSGEFGIMVVSLTRGDTLYSHNAGTPLMPASTMKMLTTAVALDRLGPKYQFSTDVLYDGTLAPDGTLHGNVYLKGDGDPSL